jgi:glycosyltransferase involved in cell wall biosynthesis
MPGSPRLFNLCRELARRHSITLLMMEDAKERQDLLLSDPETRTIFSEIEVLPPPGPASRLGRQIHRMRFEPFISTRWAQPDYYRHVCERVRARSVPGTGADVILADCLQMTQYVWGASVPAIADLHDSLSLLMARNAELEVGLVPRARLRVESRSLARWERRLRHRFASVVTNSDIDAEHIRNLDPLCPVKAISNGVDTEYFDADPSVEVDRHRIVFTGVMSYAPNADAARHLCDEIFPLVRQREPRAEFWIVGHSPTPEVVALSSQPGVHVTGSVDDVRMHVQGSRVFACPLRYGTGIKNKILAAMAMGRPVVATPVSLHGIDAKPEIEVLVGETPEQFAAQLSRVLEDDELSESIGEAGRRLVLERYSWRSRAEAIEQELRAALASSGSPRGAT